MRTMSVEWIRATRGPQERERLELTARNVILDRANGVENAYRAYLAHKASHNSPLSDWARFFKAAVEKATAPLPPSERDHVGLIVRFH